MSFTSPPPSIIDTSGGIESSGKATDAVQDRVLMFGRALEGTRVNMDTIRRYARSGIPDAFRPTYWKLLIGFLPPSPQDWATVEGTKEREYLAFLQDACVLDENQNVIGKGDRHRIDVDIPRTLPSLHFFACAEDIVIKDGVPMTFSEAQQSLRRILYSTARLNAGLGYVQGMNELVAHLLITFAGSKTGNINFAVEAQTFFCFQTLLSYVGDNFCRALDHDKTMGVTHTMEGFQRLFQFCDPQLYEHIDGCQIRPEFYAFRWITLLMTQEFLTPDVLRIWDFFFSYGEQLNDVVFYFTIAMLIYIRDSLLEMEGMSQVLVALQHYPSDTDVNELIDLTEKLIYQYGFAKLEELRHEALLEEREDGSSPNNSFGGATAVSGTHSSKGSKAGSPASPSLDRRKEDVVKAVNKAIGKVFEWGARLNGEKN